jgi:hypothetical protein
MVSTAIPGPETTLNVATTTTKAESRERSDEEDELIQ